jgi:asparagine synthase (glutamine-hydrolysing)
MSGIIGAVGLNASAVALKMCETLRHRGAAFQSVRGMLTDDVEFAMYSLGGAKLNRASSCPGLSTSVEDAFSSSYAKARITNSRFLSLDRDFVGARPLFYGVNGESSLCAFGSERKAVWAAGVEHVRRVDPGTTVTVYEPQHIEIKAKNRFKLSYGDPTLNNRDPVKNLRSLLESVLNEIADKQIGVAFSGGLDSSLLYTLTAHPIDNQCYAVGLPESYDLKNARKTARLLDVDLEIIPLHVDQVETVIPDVIEAIESCNPLDVAIALPLYILEMHIRAAGFGSVLTGQGADELFAGYAKYCNLFTPTTETLRVTLEADVLNIAKNNLERDNLAAAAHSLELLLPYLDPKVVTFGLALHCSWKLHNGINKYVLRKIAEQVMPYELAYQRKKAIQYGTGISQLLQRLARKAELPKTRNQGMSDVKLYLQSIAEKHGVKVQDDNKI